MADQPMTDETKWLHDRLDRLESKVDELLQDHADRKAWVKVFRLLAMFFGLTSVTSLGAVFALWRRVIELPQP